MKVDVIGSNSLLFANLPPASQVPGRTYRVSDVGPAPGILLTSDGTKYRPAGGRQVLATRVLNPVTVQSLTQQVAETIGPFPGGLARAGMRLEGELLYYPDGLSTGGRQAMVVVGNTIPINPSSPTYLSLFTTNVSSARVKNRLAFNLDFTHDTNGEHQSGPAATGGYGAPIPASTASISVNISMPWYIQIIFSSAAENAVNISSATWAGGIATINTAAAHTLAVGDKTVIASVTPTGWNIPAGAIVLSVPTTTQFTVALAADPGTYTSGGTSSRISNMVSQSYVLELVG